MVVWRLIHEAKWRLVANTSFHETPYTITGIADLQLFVWAEDDGAHCDVIDKYLDDAITARKNSFTAWR